VTPLHPVGIEVVGLDADDTLWHSERDFAEVQHRYRALLAHYGAPDLIESVLLATERRNLIVFGYGVKGFMLSMIETAIEISGQRITGAEIHQIVELGRSLIERPLELLPGVHAAVEALSADYRVVLITKGDLIHQETKIAASGLGELFWRVEVVSEKNPTTYRRLLERLAVDPARVVMATRCRATSSPCSTSVGERSTCPTRSRGRWITASPKRITPTPCSSRSPICRRCSAPGEPRYRRFVLRRLNDTELAAYVSVCRRSVARRAVVVRVPWLARGASGMTIGPTGRAR
jgi:putative hydrolase of the HAD superfamily